MFFVESFLYAPVAQLDRVSDSDSEGRAFESHQAYQNLKSDFITKESRILYVAFFFIQSLIFRL